MNGCRRRSPALASRSRVSLKPSSVMSRVVGSHRSSTVRHRSWLTMTPQLFRATSTGSASMVDSSLWFWVALGPIVHEKELYCTNLVLEAHRGVHFPLW